MTTEKIFRPPLSLPSYTAPIAGFALWSLLTGRNVPVQWPQLNRPHPMRPRIAFSTKSDLPVYRL